MLATKPLLPKSLESNQEERLKEERLKEERLKGDSKIQTNTNNNNRFIKMNNVQMGYPCMNRELCNAERHFNSPCPLSETNRTQLKRKFVNLEDDDALVILCKKSAQGKLNKTIIPTSPQPNSPVKQPNSPVKVSNATKITTTTPEQRIHNKYIFEFMKPLFSAFINPTSIFNKIECAFNAYNCVLETSLRVKESMDKMDAYDFIGVMQSKAYFIFPDHIELRNEYLQIYKRYMDDFHKELYALKNSVLLK